MKNVIFKKALFSLLLLLSFIGFSQNLPLSKDAKISVITCGLGNETYSYFGHTAIRVADPGNNIDVVFNYGAFDFRTPNFVAKFAKGDLQYFVIVHSFPEFIDEYNNEKRSVFEQELLVSQDIKQKLFDNLNTTLASEDRFYTYKFIDKNCTSMVVDIINKSLNGEVITKKGDTDVTYRSILFPYFNGHFYDQLGTSIIFGTKVDQLGTKIFLPFELKNSLEKTTYQNQPLVTKSKTLLSFEKETPSSWWNNVYTYLFILAFVVLAHNKIVDKIYLLILSCIGIFFVFMGFYSFHQELAMNYNVLLFSPLLLILIFLSILKNKRWTYRFAVLHLIFLIVYAIFLINKAHFLIVLPMIITSGFVLVRVAIRNKKRIPIII
ncbi:lipoprotein N-acyltransferase Lnb domain-containing protein [Flavobacterium bizetiae]|uniref:lipoprotein N-acyltransferase Lnb domain-containing protein n=1 Tax=Flavobacterium bizetiae TaxID=2704140 RepID=UPI0037577252